ncbi:hypothetical protein [Sporomusa aerivorans]|uniref:hypothetical protein n=1 Tax=Sporomusa aerivorans TaxID=204936 RepID=UPI00352AFF66
MQTKICRKCGNELPLDNFYKHKEMLDGHLNHCKECVKSRVRNHRKDHQEYFKEYEFNRNRTTKRREWKKKHVNKTKINKKNREIKRLSLKQRRQTIEGYQKSHNAFTRAVKSGKIVRPDICQVCGTADKVIGHHCDYTKPLNVVWLCNACHGLYHSSENELGLKVKSAVNLLFEIGLKGIS